MRFFTLGLILLTVGMVSSCSKGPPTFAKGAPGEKFPTESIVQMLETNGITQLEIFGIVEDAETPISMRPEDLERHPDFSVTLKSAGLYFFEKELIAAFKESTVKYSSHGGDVRWGCYFYNADHVRLFTLYLDQIGQGEINGSEVQSCEKIVAVLRQRCSPLWEPTEQENPEYYRWRHSVHPPTSGALTN